MSLEKSMNLNFNNQIFYLFYRLGLSSCLRIFVLIVSLILTSCGAFGAKCSLINKKIFK